MRLTEFEKKSILGVFKKYSPSKGVIYLFGSRVDDSKRGGDIDLTLANQEDLSTDPFLKSIMNEAVKF